MKIGILTEASSDEKRIAATPETIQKYVTAGFYITIESNAGKDSGFSDSDYKDAGATISKAPDDILKTSDIILCVNAHTPDATLKKLKEGAIIIGLASPHESRATLPLVAAKRVSLFDLELLPRISRAQSMDVLSSQSNLAGYKAVIDGISLLTKAAPMMMTAAGKVTPANVLVMGAGVAGLQAIATAKRLGAVVLASDVRPMVKEQVESLGGKFLEVETNESLETDGGYAKEVSDDYKMKQAELLEQTITTQDLVITTALIPGRPAPELISKDMVKSMKPGSVIVDLAAANGGNCALTKPGQITTEHGITIVGYENFPSRLAHDSSQLYARNVYNFLMLMWNQESQELDINLEDSIVAQTMLTHDGAVSHPDFQPETEPTATAKKVATKAPTETVKKKSTTTKTATKTGTKRTTKPKQPPKVK